MENKWLKWASELQAIAQIGLEYTQNPYDRERFERVRQISVEIMSEYTGMDHTRIRDLFANEKGYQTPKIDVRAAIFKDDRILLARETVDSKWSMPGGWADIGLSVYENAAKEAREEAGAAVRPKRIIAVLDRNRHQNDAFPYSVYKIFVECDYLGGGYVENIETLAAEFFTLDGLPELSTGRNTRKQIEMCFRAHEDPDFATIGE